MGGWLLWADPLGEKKTLKIWAQGSANGHNTSHQVWICFKRLLMVWVRCRAECNPAQKMFWLVIPCSGHSSTWVSGAWLGSHLGKAAHGSWWSCYCRWVRAAPGRRIHRAHVSRPGLVPGFWQLLSPRVPGQETKRDFLLLPLKEGCESLIYDEHSGKEESLAVEPSSAPSQENLVWDQQVLTMQIESESKQSPVSWLLPLPFSLHRVRLPFPSTSPHIHS